MIDDLKGRKIAHHLGISITGTIEVIIEAKQVGVIPSVKEVLLKIKQSNFRITRHLEMLLLKKAGEE